MRRAPRLPRVISGGRTWSADALERLAVAWRGEIDEAVGGENVPVAVALPSSAESVALFAAASSRPAWTIVLPADTGAWTPDLALPITSAAAPQELTVLFPPAIHEAVAGTGARPGAISGSAIADARRLGCRTLVLGAPATLPSMRGGPPLPMLRSPGVVLFTSGSTGMPKPVYRTMDALVAGVTARLDALELRDGDGIVAGVSLAHGHGLTRLISAMVLGGAFGLLDPVDHRTALSTLAQPQFALWSATAHFADVLGRCRLTGPAIAPRICLLSSPVSRQVFDAFRARFGVPLRQNYSSSETGVIAVDSGPADDVQPDTVGHVLPGVALRIGDVADDASPAVDGGRIWIRSPWLMAGYGFPPAVARSDRDGWWPTRDLGVLQADGRLRLAGRIDDCIRTREGRLVNLAWVAGRLREIDGVGDVAVVPIAGPAGASFGAVLTCAAEASLAQIRDRAAAALPSWAWPRAIVQMAMLPRLTGGKINRRACIAALEGVAS